MALKVGELFASFNLDTSGIDGAISGAEKKLSSLGKGMAIGGAAMSAAVTAPIVGAFKDIYSKGSEFNSQMSKVFAIRGLDSTLSADVEAMDQLNAKALEMGSTTKFTASEAGQAFEYMAMAGWDTASMLGGIEPILNLAAAAGEDLGTTSDIVTDAMTAFGYTIDKVGGDTLKFTEMTTHFTDVLAAVSSNANTNVSMLGESFKYVGSIAGSLGYSIEDTAVALGIMANSGIKSSQAGTSLRTIMTRLNGDIKISGKNLKEVTVKTSNADGSMRDFSEIIADCREAFKGLTESEKAQVAESLVGRNAMSGFLTLMNATDDEIASLTGAINNCNGATKRMADMMLDNVGGSVTLFKSAVEGLEITLWELVKGPVKDLIDRATSVVDAFRNMDSATQMGALKMAGFAAAIGPVLTASGGLLMALPKIAKGVAALASPLGVVGVGLLAFTAAAMDSNNQIGQTFEKMGKGVKKTLTGVNKQLNKKFLSWNYKTGKSAIGSQMIAFSESIITGLKDIIPAGMETVRLFMQALMTGIRDSASSLAGVGKTVITELLNGISRSLPRLIPLAAEMVTNIATALISNAPEILSAGITLFTTLIESLNKVNWAEIGTKINESIKAALSDIKTNLFTLVFGEEPKGDDLGDWGKFGSKVVERIKDGIQAALSSARDFFGSLLLGEDYKPDEDWASFGTKIIDKIFEGADGAASGASEFVGGILTGISNMFTDDSMSKASGTLSTIAGTLIDHVFAEIPKLAGRAGTLLEKLATLILGNESSNGLAANVLDGATQLVNAIFTAITAGMESGNGTSAAQKLLDVLGKAFSSENISRITTSLNGLIEAIFTGMSTVLPQFASQAGDVIKGIIDLMFKKNESGTSLFGSALTSVQTLVSTLIRSIIDFIPQATSTATNLLSTLLDTLFAPQGEEGTEKSLAQDALESVKGLVNTILRSIPGLIQTMGSSAVSIITSLGEMLTRKDENGKYIASGIVDSLSELITQAITDLLALIPSLGESITGIIGAIGDVLLAKDDEGNYLITSLSSSLIELVKSAITTTVAAIPGIANLVSEIIGAIAGILSEKDENGNYKVTGIVDSLTQMVRDAIDTVIALIPTLGSSAERILTAIGAALFGTGEDEGAISQGVTALTGIVQTIFTELNTKVIPSMGTEVGKILTTIAGFFTPEKLKDLGTGLGDLAGALLTGVIDTLVATVDTLLAIGDDADTDGMFKGVLGGINAFAGKVIEALANAIPKIVGAGGKILGRLAEIFSPENIGGMITEAQSVARGLMDTIMEAFTGEQDAANKVDLFGTFAKIVGNIIDGLKDVFTPENIEKNAINVEGFVTGLIDSISTSLSDGIDTASEEGIFGKFIGLLKNLVSGIVKAIPHAFKVGEKAVTAGFQIATELLHSITEGFTDGSLDIDLGGLVTAWISSLSGILGGALDFGGEVVSAGVLLAGNLLDSLASAFDSTVSTEGVSAIGEKLGDIARKIITGITTLLPKLFEVGGKAISAGVKLATELIGSLAEGFTGTDFSGSFATMAQGLVQGIIDAVTNLPALLDGVLSTGAQIANAIMESVTNTISEWKKNGTGSSLATAATNLVHGLLTSITNFAGNPDVQSFIENLGQGLHDTLYMLGEFGTDLVMNLFSAETLQRVYDAGKGLINLLLGGLGTALDGISGFLDGIVSSILERLGIIDKDAIKKEVDIGNALNDAIIESITDSDGKLVHTAESIFATIMGAYASGSSDAFDNLIEGTELEQIMQKLDSFFFENSDMWSGYTGTVEEFNKAFIEAFSGSGIDIQPILDALPDDFWQIAMDAITGNANKGEGMPLMQLLLNALFGGDKGTDTGERDQKVSEFYENLGVTGKEAAAQAAENIQQGNADVIQAAQEGSNAFGQAGTATAILENAGEVEAAALSLEDSVVQTFLMTMGAENGYLIGENFVLAMGAAMSDKTADMSAIALSAGQAAFNALNGSASYANGYTIGYNFGLGFVNGIESMIDRAASAAASLGAAGTSSLSNIIQEGSPSRITGESGDNFGLGFINHILDSVDGAADAAARMGRSAGDALAYTVRGIGAEAAEIPLPQRSGYARMAEAYPSGQQNNPAVEQMTNRIIEALSHMGVYIDGEPAGHVLTPYISEEIAHNTSVRR